MDMQALVKDWFDKWAKGDFHHLPLADRFRHTSPFGTIEGKAAYLKLAEENQDKFLGYSFQIHDAIYEGSRACVRYTGTQGDFSLDVSEWYYASDGLIVEIIAYYHIGEVREERRLKG